MKRSVEVLVLMEMVAVIVAMAIGGLSGMASAALPVVRIRADASLQKPHGSDASAAIFDVDTTFSTDTPGAQLFTVQRVVLWFPDRAGTNGRLFSSCSAREIERFKGNIRRCPEGSRIGSGTVKAQALQLGIAATGHVTMFNSGRGKGVTFNVQTYLPAYINRSFDAEIVRLHRGRYGERLTLEVPQSLQEILSGVFVAVKEFDVTITGSVRRNGVTHSYIKARTCPERPLRGVFDFKDWTTGQIASVTTDAELRCTVS